MTFLSSRNSPGLGLGGLITLGVSSTPSTPPFDPLTLPGILRWYDASDEGMVTTVDGKVSVWADKSNGGADLEQETDGNRYTYSIEAVNGLNVMVGSANTHHMTMTESLDLTTTGWAVVIASVNDTRNFMALGKADQSVYIGRFINNGSDAVTCSYTFLPTITGTGSGMSADGVNCFIFRNVDTSATMWWNGSQIGSATWGPSEPFVPTFNCEIQGTTNMTSNGLRGKLCEVMAGVGELTDDDIAAITSYSQSKWGTP